MMTSNDRLELWSWLPVSLIRFLIRSTSGILVFLWCSYYSYGGEVVLVVFLFPVLSVFVCFLTLKVKVQVS